MLLSQVYRNKAPAPPPEANTAKNPRYGVFHPEVRVFAMLIL